MFSYKKSFKKTGKKFCTASHFFRCRVLYIRRDASPHEAQAARASATDGTRRAATATSAAEGKPNGMQERDSKADAPEISRD